MGFLVESIPLDWDDAIDKLKYVREHGIEQFINVFFEGHDIKQDLLKYGDEIEYSVCRLVGTPDDPNRTVKISLRSPEIIRSLHAFEAHGRNHGLSEADMCSWMPEYGRWMLEGVPRKPFEGVTALTGVENHMRLRRSRLLAQMLPGEVVPTMAVFPLLGVGDFWVTPDTRERLTKEGPVAQSLFVPDEITYPHARFATLTKNIRKRRGEKVRIERPKYVDEFTDIRTRPQGVPTTEAEADRGKTVYADAMAFGMGACCLQVTFQAANLGESRHLYDHLAVLTPIMMALTAASPYLRGWLVAEDVRWSVVADSVDDRTPDERGSGAGSKGDTRMAGNGTRFLRKSRYGGIDCYISQYTDASSNSSSAEQHNDMHIECDQAHVDRLMLAGVDRTLARHVAHLFCRDPLVIFKDRVYLCDRASVDHWENLQSTNWQSVRWKPPHPEKGRLEISSEKHIGWRVEFRTMELQMTDFENAAFTVFVVLISRVLLALELNLYIPISKLEENMRSAHKINAAVKERFWFRKVLLPREVRRNIGQQKKKREQQRMENKEEHDRNGPGFATPSKVVLSEGAGGGGKYAANSRLSPGTLDQPGYAPLIPTCDSDDEISHDDKFYRAESVPMGHDDDEYERMTIQEILSGKDCSAPRGIKRHDLDDEDHYSPYSGSSNAGVNNQPSNTDIGTVDSEASTPFCGSGAAGSTGACHFPGLIPLCKTYLDFIGVDSVTRDKLYVYLDFIKSRATGETMTNAKFIRQFIRSHPSYKKDSRVPQDAAYDLVLKAKRIGEGLEHCPEILGNNVIPRCYAAANPFTEFVDAVGEGAETFLQRSHSAAPPPSPGANGQPLTGTYLDTDTAGEYLRPDERKCFKYGCGQGNVVNAATSTPATTNGTSALSPAPGVTATEVYGNGKDAEISESEKGLGSERKHSATELESQCTAQEKGKCLVMTQQKQDLLHSYLVKAKQKRDTALQHALKMKRTEMEGLASEIQAIQKDLCTSVTTVSTKMPVNMSAERLVEANSLFQNRSSYMPGNYNSSPNVTCRE